MKCRGLLGMGLAFMCMAGSLQAAPPGRFDARRPPARQPAAEAVRVPADALHIFTLSGPHDQVYRVQVAALGPRPADGYPVLFLLDGNAAMAALTALRTAPALSGSVLLVAVGYDTDAYFDTTARSLDYTPPLPDGRAAFDPRVPGRRGGGADRFLDFMAERLLPRIRADWPVASTPPGIWGHSYGGLLVLHALFERPGMFAFHAAASPSLWWHAPLLQDAAQAYATHSEHVPARLLLMRGGNEHRRGRSGAQASGAWRMLLQELRGVDGLDVHVRNFADMAHGAVFSASLGPAIRAFVGAGKAHASQALRPARD